MILPTETGTNSYGVTAFVIRTTYPENPKHVSEDVAKAFGELVKNNQDKEEFVVKGFKPNVPIADGGVLVKFIYDVELYGKHLCTVFEFRDIFGEPYSRMIEFQGLFYNSLGHNIISMIVARWKRDEEKRQAKLTQKTNNDAMAFLGTFAKEKQYQ